MTLLAPVQINRHKKSWAPHRGWFLTKMGNLSQEPSETNPVD